MLAGYNTEVLRSIVYSPPLFALLPEGPGLIGFVSGQKTKVRKK